VNRARRAFSLLEVMISLAILVASLAILLETMSSAAIATNEAERIVTATQLAQEKMTEVQLLIEREGITQRDQTESGEFDEFGDAELDLEFGSSLEDYHYEWSVAQVDIGLAGDIASMAQSLEGTGLVPPTETEAATGLEDQSPDLASLGISNDMITDMLGRYIREIRVRVWWGDDSAEAEKRGDEVILTSHLTDPSGGFVNTAEQDPQE